MLSRDRVVIIGQAPSSRSDWRRPLVGGETGENLRALTGLSMRRYVKTFEFRNVLGHWPGRAPDGKGDLFPRAQARAAAAAMTPELSGRRVVLLGRAVADAFGVRNRKWFEFYLCAETFHAAVMPHPSRVSRFWNSQDNVDRARAFMRSLITGGHDG